MDKVILFGGSFNPIHKGHFEIAEGIRKMLFADQVIFIPTFSHPSKGDTLASFYHRVEMIKLALRSKLSHDVSTIERELGSPSYTLHTVEAFMATSFRKELFLLLGSDMLMDFHKWKGAERLSKIIKIITVPRPKGISSTLIREAITAGKDVGQHLDPRVLDYIETNKLYR